MSKRNMEGKGDPDAPATPPSTVPYKRFACPEKCGYSELAGRTPFWSDCPQCHKPVGKLVEAPTARPAAKRKR